MAVVQRATDRKSSTHAALLIVGNATGRFRAAAPALTSAFGRIGELLLAAGSGWRVVRLAPGGPPYLQSTRANILRELAALEDRQADLILIAVAGNIITADGGAPMLETSADGSAMPLATLHALPRTKLVLAVAGWEREPADGPTAQWRDTVLRIGGGELVIVGAGEHGAATIDALHAGLSGDAIDTATGTITLRSLSACLARAPGLTVKASSARDTVIAPPPLAGAWDPRLTRRPRSLPAVVPDEPDDLVRITLPGQFRIDAELAQGSFGVVYRAKQLAVGRDVAVKVLHANVNLASPGGRMFVHEIQCVGRIEHPNVVRIYHADVTVGGRLFFAMELLAGRDLEHVLQAEGCMPPPRALALIGQLLAGLGAAHDAGLVHADIKPANLVLVPERRGDRLVLVDFGLARLRGPGAPVRTLGGTPAYMAPEQLRNGRVDTRSDLFAAAMVFVTLLTGWRRRAKEQLVPPLDDIADPALRDILRRALAIAPAERFQSAAELADALTGATPAAPPPRMRPGSHSAVLVETTADRFHGRTHELDQLLDAVLYGGTVVIAGLDGIGKTALVRDGLLPRLAPLGARAVYVTCRAGAAIGLARTIDPAASNLGDALARLPVRGGGKLVLIVDQLEAALVAGGHGERPLVDLLASELATPGADLAIVACIRTAALPVLRAHGLPPYVTLIPLGGLDDDGAREAIVAPFEERRLAIEPALVDALLVDLRRAAARRGQADRTAREGCYPPQLRQICAALHDALGPDEAVVTLAHYRRLGGAAAITAPARRAKRLRGTLAALAAGASCLTFAAWYQRSAGVAPRAAAVVPPGMLAAGSSAPPPGVLVGGSGTVLWGFFAPLNAFLEETAEVAIPISSQRDLGSGGAMRALDAGTIDVAAMSGRYGNGVPARLRAAGAVLVEVAIGFDETSLFVRGTNPLRSVDIADVRAHLCCAPGRAQRSLTWQDLGVTATSLAGRRVTWILYGRQTAARLGTTSATLAQADAWLCAPDRLCPSPVTVDVEADEVLAALVTDTDRLALSSRSFATAQVAAVAVVDRTHHTRLDGRKVLWLYFAMARDAVVPPRLCRFFDAVLDPAIANRLAAVGKALGLPDPLRQRQRSALGLQDATCGRTTGGALAQHTTTTDGIVHSPIADDVEINVRWTPDR